MNVLPMDAEPSRIGLAGDWHGNLICALSQLERLAGLGAEIVVQLGDFGFWTAGPSADKYISRMTRMLESIDLHLLFVDGNHEDHSRLNLIPIDEPTGLRKITNRIWHLPRGHRWQWSGYAWMSVGGAHSVDRQYRVVGESWWAAEHLSDADLARTKRAGSVDVMVTHDAPDGVDIPVLRRKPQEVVPWPAEEILSAEVHRGLLGEVVRQVQPKRLWHGHYHCRYADEMIIDGRPVLVEGLGDDDGHWADNVVIVGPDGAQQTV